MKIDQLTHKYFAYGSNMHPGQMLLRCPGAKALGVARLDGWAVRINDRGVATIVPRDQSSVEGVLWDATTACMKALDRYEGVSVGLYSRANVAVQTGEGVVDAVVYIGGSADEGDPRPGYLQGILAGAECFGVSEEHMNRLRNLARGPLPWEGRGGLIPDCFFDYEDNLRGPEPYPGEADEVQAQLEEVRQQIALGDVGTAEEWSGAGVVIESIYRVRRPGGFFPEPLHVTTTAAPELSWLFERICEIFGPTSYYAHGMKEELFDRLGRVALRRRLAAQGNDRAVLLHEVLDEALHVLHQLDGGTFFAPDLVVHTAGGPVAL